MRFADNDDEKQNTLAVKKQTLLLMWRGRRSNGPCIAKWDDCCSSKEGEKKVARVSELAPIAGC